MPHPQQAWPTFQQACGGCHKTPRMWGCQIRMSGIDNRPPRRPDRAGPPFGRSGPPGPDFSTFAHFNEILPRCRKSCPESENCAPVMKFSSDDVNRVPPDPIFRFLPRCRKHCPKSENCTPVTKLSSVDVISPSRMKLKRSGPISHGLRPRSPMRRLSLTKHGFGPQVISRAQRCEQRFLPVLLRAPWPNKPRGRSVRLVGLLPVVRDRA